jgi:hypothetical protein
VNMDNSLRRWSALGNGQKIGLMRRSARLGGPAVDTFVCANCTNRFPLRQIKEVFWEEGRKRLKQELCPSCLDQRMNEADEVRGIVGQRKAAAIHVDSSGSRLGTRKSMGERQGLRP